MAVTRSNGAETTQQDVPIAIIGLAFEFAQDAVSEESFWKLIVEGRSTESEFPKDRLNIDAFYHTDDTRPNTLSFRGGNFVKEDLGAFDAPFFSITPGEAACMDPQHRRMLEISYHALENAGLPLSQCCGSDTSVYTGCFTHDYFNVLQHDHDVEQRHAALGVPASMLANRISWFFDFKGPSTNLDSACSSSMMALHLACQDLRTGTSSMGLVGGANLIYHPDFLQMLSNFSFISPDSRSWSFDERANGYARGEGIAAIIVKRLDDAIRDGDTIRAVIRATNSNQDGRTPGITQPSQEAQLELIRQTYERAQLQMEPTRFFEAHGTGTAIGDPTEAGAIGRAFSKYRSLDDPLYIGAVKSNLGHLEGGSGLAGVIKTILVLEQGIIPPISGLENLNHRIDNKGLHLEFPKSPVQWPTSGLRRACVNSFGFGGSNSIVILDDALNYLRERGLVGNHQTKPLPHTGVNGISDPSHLSNGVKCKQNGTAKGSGKSETRPILLVSSGNDQDSATQLSKHIAQYTLSHDDEITNVAYALAHRRNHFTWRSFQVLKPHGQLDAPESEPGIPVKSSNEHATAWVFTGQGAQYAGMGCGLSVFPSFKETLDRLEQDLQTIGCRWSLQEILDSRSTSTDINQPEYSQTVTTCLQIALVDLLRSFGIVPSVVLGHSSGEIAAAYAKGALSRSSAVKAAYWRGIMSARVAANTKDLGMMAVGLPRNKVSIYLKKLESSVEKLEVSIGCINSPNGVTLTGRSTQLSVLESWFKKESIFARRLRVTVAYHSPFMSDIAEEYQTAMGQLEQGAVSRSAPMMISSVTGHEISQQELCSSAYWVRNMISPVEFDEAVTTLLSLSKPRARKQLGRKNNNNITLASILEIGPHSALQGPIRECLQTASTAIKPRYISSQVRDQDASVSILKAAGMLYCTGYPIDWETVNDFGSKPRAIPERLPLYPFNHKNSYWKESRISKNFRFRKFARHDLLGTRNLDWNNQMAQWKNTIRVRELPWLEDHEIGSQIIFPGAGMIVMALEALKQILPRDTTLQAVKLRDVDFMHAMRIPADTNSIETQFNLSLGSSMPKSDEWSSFRLFMIEKDDYIECCRGLISPILTKTEVERASHSPSFLGSQTPMEWLDHVSRAVHDEVLDTYTSQDGNGIVYGPTFQNVNSMRLGVDGQATATIRCFPSTPAPGPSQSSTFSIHPTTLDGLAQLIVPALTMNRQNPLPAMVPAHIDNIFLNLGSNDQLVQSDLDVAAVCQLRSKRGALANIFATSTKARIPAVYFEGLRTSFIEANASSEQSSGLQTRHLCTQMIWQPDVDLMTNTEIRDWCLQGRPEESSRMVDIYEMTNLAVLCFVEGALDFLEQHESSLPQGYLSIYADWLRYQKQRFTDGDLQIDNESLKKLLQNPQAQEDLFKAVEQSGSEGAFFVHIGRNLIQVLKGDTNALDLMFKDGVVDRYYQEVLVQEHRIHPALSYLNLLSFKNPSMKILEIGAGTGGQTLRMMDTMAQNNTVRWAQYDFTDISPSFFARARERLSKYSGLVNFKVCDISQDVVAQSFEPESYDLIIAAHVLHATDDIDGALSNVKKLLKPGGRFLLAESTKPESLRIGFAFGLLESWWDAMAHEKRSKLSPLIATSDWDRRMRASGLTGVDAEFHDSDDVDRRYSSVIVSQATPKTVKSSIQTTDVALIVDQNIQIQRDVATSLQSRLSACHQYTLDEVRATDLPASTVLVFLLEMNTRCLDGISGDAFEALKSILSKHKTSLWITSTESGSTDPSHCLVHGFGRSLCSEDASRKFVTLNIDRVDYDLDQLVDKTQSVLEQVIDTPIENVENDYMVTPDGTKVGRISKCEPMNVQVARAQSDRYAQEIEIGAGTDLAIHHSSMGRGQDVELREDDSAASPLEADEVMVDMKALGLTHRDLLVMTGQIDDLGLFSEGAGIVRSAGKQSGYQVGDRVCVLAHSIGRTCLRVKANSVASIPETMDFNQVASMPSAAWLSYHTLVNIGRVRQGDHVLLHRASSSFGRMALRMAQGLGANVLLTASSDGKRNSLCAQLRIEKDLVLDSADPLLASRLSHATNGRGLDLVIGAMNLDSETDFAKVLSPCGQIIDIGLSTPSGLYSSSSFKLDTNVSATRIDMMKLLKDRPLQAGETLRKAVEMVTTLKIECPQPIHSFGIGSLQDALKHLQNSSVPGKRVVELIPGTKVLANLRTKSNSSLCPNATYVIAGGLGGLGRVIARWFASRGARNLILLSRSGAKTVPARELVQELQDKGVVCATPSVDISSSQSLRECIDNLMKTMPPIKGCVQATVALRDNVFENMSHDDWSVSTSSKVTGSWNLHATLPPDLDFFILLSSIGGVYGARAQTNYAAGNTYKDALAKYRVSQGLKAVSLDLGFMIDEGVVAENDFLFDSMKRIGLLMEIKKEEMLAILDYYCDASLPVLGEDEAQLLTGLELPSIIRANGHDLHHALARPMASHLFRMTPNDSSTVLGDGSGPNGAGGADDRATRLAHASSDAEANEIIFEWLLWKLGLMLGLSESEIDPARPLHTYGIDSLVAIDLKNWLSRQVGVEFAVFELMGNTSLAGIAALVGERRRNGGKSG